jgi:hypothetical protein
MTMREHLNDFHKRAAEFHLNKAKSYGALGKSFGNMRKAAKVEDDDSEDVETTLAALAEEELSMGEFHVSCCKTLDAMGKAIGMDRDAIMPDFVSSVIPEVHAIPRFGQREITKGDVPQELEKLVSFD